MNVLPRCLSCLKWVGILWLQNTMTCLLELAFHDCSLKQRCEWNTRGARNHHTNHLLMPASMASKSTDVIQFNYSRACNFEMQVKFEMKVMPLHSVRWITLPHTQRNIAYLPPPPPPTGPEWRTIEAPYLNHADFLGNDSSCPVLLWTSLSESNKDWSQRK